MKLNHKITISSIWNEEKQVNETSVDFHQETTLSEVFTVLKMAEIALNDTLETYIKNNYKNGKCTEEEFKQLFNTKLSKL